MNNLQQYINKSYPNASLPINEASSNEEKIYFPTVAAALIYEFELSGQISDGYWENARPYDHWQWIGHTEPIVDKDKCGYTGFHHRKTYSTDWLRRYVKKALKNQAGDYDWTIRVFNYAKFGSIINPQDFEKIYKEYAYRSIIEDMPEEEVNHDQLEAAYNTSDYKKKYWDKAGAFFTDELLKKYYSSDYGWSEFEDDLELAETAINTNLHEEK